ncbi:MAG: CDGSH iron-sulfur domain-containing protein [Paludibacter sp.]|nr:CDGSH iron-sulfur domain-containing protein [Paludibacter sp.]
MSENSIEVKVIKGGPSVVSGNFKLILASGEEKEMSDKTFLCRCGQSKNKPFCDGSHKNSDFDK